MCLFVILLCSISLISICFFSNEENNNNDIEVKTVEVKSEDPTTNVQSGSLEVLAKIEENEKDKDLAPMSIYELYSRKKASWLLVISALGCLQMPFADTIYFPSLKNIEEEFHTTAVCFIFIFFFFFFVNHYLSFFLGPFNQDFHCSR